MVTWQEIWSRRLQAIPNSQADGNVLESLIKINGFDNDISSISLDSWTKYVGWVSRQLEIMDNDSVFEVGCGAGAFLYHFYENHQKVGGIDYSPELVDKASALMPNGEFCGAEASDLTTGKRYDFVVANSLFFYFKDYEYAQIVLMRMYEKAIKGIAILDVPNLRLKSLCEEERRLKLPDYETRYRDLKHLYFAKSWFLEFAEQKGAKIMLFDQDIVNYGHNKYRFNCIIRKTECQSF
jgi:SAM-dependent methyltransferase